MWWVTSRAPGALATVVLLAAHPCGASVVLRARPLAVGIERFARLPCSNSSCGWGLNARVLDFGLGPRIAADWSATLDVTPINHFQTMNIYAGPDIDPSVGISVLFGRSLRRIPHGPQVVVRIDGSWLDTPKFVRVALGTNATWWALSPEFELSWRHEWANSRGTGVLYQYDWIAASTRLGLGGTYEF